VQLTPKMTAKAHLFGAQLSANFRIMLRLHRHPLSGRASARLVDPIFSYARQAPLRGPCGELPTIVCGLQCNLHVFYALQLYVSDSGIPIFLSA
jgi:hypothetical protein